jgi:hypothetical protein
MTVATPASVQGFAQDREAPFVVAADGVSFAVAVADRLRLLQPQADERRARDYVTRYYGVQSSFGGLAQALGLQSSVISRQSSDTGL